MFFARSFAFRLITVLNINIGNIPIARADREILFTKTGNPTEVEHHLEDPPAAHPFMAAILGGALSLAGFLLQTFFENPIAGPFVLGISSGAKMVVAFAMIYFIQIFGVVSSYTLILAAFVGSLLSVGFILLFSRRIPSMSTLLVAGIMIGYICTAITDFTVTFAADSDIVNLHNWSKGSFSGMNWSNVGVAATVVGITGGATFLMAKPIGAYQLGEAYAQSMGVNIKAFRTALKASILSGHAVTAFCRTDLVRRHRRAVPHPALSEHIQPPVIRYLGRRRILYAVRSHRAHGLRADGAEHQHRHVYFRRAGRYLHDATPEGRTEMTDTPIL